MAAVRVLPGGVRGEDRLHRLGPAISHSGQGPVYTYGYGRSRGVDAPQFMLGNILTTQFSSDDIISCESRYSFS